MEELNQYINHEDPIVRGAANGVKLLKKELHAGEITQSQFEELAADLLERDEVRRMASNLERKIKILQAFNAIRTIVGIALK